VSASYVGNGLTRDQISTVCDLCIDLIKVGYVPFMVQDSSSHCVDSIAHIMSTMRIIDSKFTIMFKRAVGDNTVLRFDVESDTLCLVSFDSNSMCLSPFYKYFRSMS